jgi:hypothetical protein
MTERVDIANIALSLLGQNEIESLEDSGKAATQMKLHYTIARDATLEAYEWTFAMTRFIPNALEDPPLWGWEFAFPIPVDVLRVLQVDRNTATAAVIRDNRQQRNQVDHVVEGKEILTNENPIYCTGIKRIEQEGMFSNLFAHAFAAKLAFLTCYAITESHGKLDRIAGIYKGFITEAKTRDGMQSTTRRMRTRSLSRVR